MKPDTLQVEPARAPARAPRASVRDKPAGPLAVLQQRAGNHAIQRMLAGAVVQRACDCGTCERCQAKSIHAHGEDTLSGEFLSGKGSGQPLGDSVRGFMETRFGHDFGAVRVHTDGHAARSAGQISALAYTAGSDIFFAPGRYQPESDAGRHLLAHELTHVIQQGGSSMAAQAQLSVGPADDAYEREADRAADAVMGSGAAALPISSLAAASVQRRPCVSGRFDATSAQYRITNSEEDARALDGKWNRSTGWYESPLKVQAAFQREARTNHCANGELRLYAYGKVDRYDPWARASIPRGNVKQVDPPQTMRAYGGFAEMRLQANPDKPGIEQGRTESVRYLPHAGDCRIEAVVVPGIRAVQAGEHLDGRLVIVGELVDTCDPAVRPAGQPFATASVLDRMVCALDVDFEVPGDFNAGVAKAASAGQSAGVSPPANGSEVKDVAAASLHSPAQPPEKKASSPGRSREAKETAPRGSVTGEFASIPSGKLVAAWDAGRIRFGREFYMRARFEPLAVGDDCREGEYRQFVQAKWIRQRPGGRKVEEGPAPEQPRDITKRLCEDTFVENEGKGDEKVSKRYGHRADMFRYDAGNSHYGPDRLTGCLFRGWDYPHMVPSEAGELVEMQLHFVGQLIDKSVSGRGAQDSPYTKGVLRQSDWWVEGSFTAPPDYKAPAEATRAPQPVVQNTGTRPANMQGSTTRPAAQGQAPERKEGAGS